MEHIWFDFDFAYRVFILLLFYFLYRAFKNVPHNGNLARDVKKVQADVETSFLELWDYVESTLTPLRARLNTRVRRMDAEDKKQEDLSMQETKQKKGGILSPQEAKKYGINR